MTMISLLFLGSFRSVKNTDCLPDNILMIKFNKCVFEVSEVEFLYHHISLLGVHPLALRVSAVADLPCSTTIKQHQEFVVMLNCYHLFPNLYHTMAPLTGNSKTLMWEMQQEEAFTTLSFPALNAPFFLFTDARNIALGSMLEQVVDALHTLWNYSAGS